MAYKVLDTHSLQLVKTMDEGKESILNFDKREYAQIYSDRHINNNLKVIKDSMNENLRNKIESNYGRLTYVEDHPDGKGQYAVAMGQTKDSHMLLNIKSIEGRNMVQVKYDVGDRRVAFQQLAELRDKDFKQITPLDKEKTSELSQTLTR